jgi:hypothetical protein
MAEYNDNCLRDLSHGPADVGPMLNQGYPSADELVDVYRVPHVQDNQEKAVPAG